MQARRITLVVLALAAITASMPAGNATNVSSACDDNTTTFGGTQLENTIVASPAAFIGVGGNTIPPSVGSQHVGSQSTPAGNTDPIDTPAVHPDPITTLPRFQTNWTPDCVTIEAGKTLTWTNADAEAVHAPELGLGACWKAPAGLAVPRQDSDRITFSYDEATSSVVATVISVRAANTAAPGAPSVVVKSVACTPLQLAVKRSAAGDQIEIPGLVVDEEHRIAEVSYTCIVHHAAMTGHVRIHF
ncbi:MAG TPA: hypothetical protein VM370_01895 [Candidatus Thermoplasmatota archaeon]|nr:hypothetical protein [Candidatus Thermoplasmatota archaeon]